MSRQIFNGLILAFLFSGILMAHDSSSQRLNEIKITLEQNSSNLGVVLGVIENQTAFAFSYSQDINMEAPVSINAGAKSLDIILREVGYQAKVNFFRRNDLIAVSNAKSTAKKADIIVMLDKEIVGKVSDENGDGLPGVNVVAKNTTVGTITDTNGNYTLSVPDDTEILFFSYVGYTSEEVEIAGRSTIDISLIPDISTLSEIVVIGYGSVQKKDLTGSVASIDAEKLQNIPSSRIDQVLQGRAAGVFVTSSSANPNSRASIRVRGGNSIQGDNEPLFVVDGFPVPQGFDLNSINVNDIQSVEVLKDASSVAIYGARGANGVVLITTKSGENNPSGKPVFNANYYTGFSNLTNKIPLLTGPERAAYANEAAVFEGAAEPFADANAVPDTDWQDLITRTATINNLDLSFSGRTPQLNYYVSANYFQQQGIVEGSGIDRYQFRVNLDKKISEKFKFGVKTNIGFTKVENGKVSLFNTLKEAFTYLAPFDDEGNFTNESPVIGQVFNNPLADIALKDDHTFSTNILATAYLQFQPIVGLTIKSTIGPNLRNVKRNRFNSGQLPSRLLSNRGASARVDQTYFLGLLNENTISYQKTLSDAHSFNLLAGFTWQTEDRETSAAITDGISNDVNRFNNLSLGDLEQHRVESGYTGRQLVSWLGRVNYSYQNKYLLTLAGRVDGSSVFGQDNKYAFFPSGAIAWKLIEEPFIQNLGLFDDLKLRVSFGVAGSQAIPTYRTLQLLESQNALFNDALVNGLRSGRPANSALKWETTEQLDIGFEAAFLEGRLSVEIDYYKKNTRDLLLNVQTSPITGFGSRLSNLGELQNQGIELLVDATIIDKGDFKWQSTLTLAGNRSKALDINDAEQINFNYGFNGGGRSVIIKGQPVGIFHGYEYLGIFKDQSELDNAPADVFAPDNFAPGFPKFRDVNEDGVLSPTEDFVRIGNPEPTIYGGLNSSFSYKNFTLDVYVQGTFGNDINNLNNGRMFFGGLGTNLYGEIQNRWTPENTDSDIPRAGAFATVSAFANAPNSALVEDGSFVRVKTVRLNYDFPVSNVQWINGASLYFTINNLALITDYRGYNPEVNNKSFDQGLGARRGVDEGTYPENRTFIFGVRAQF